MTTKLRTPIPKLTPGAPPISHEFPVTAGIFLDRGNQKSLPPLEVVLQNRASKRDFVNPLTFADVSSLLWNSARSRELDEKSFKHSRVYPSAGGCYPISIGLLNAPEHEKTALIYHPKEHAFGVIDSPVETVSDAVNEISECLSVNRGTVFFFFANPEKLKWKYDHEESLMWRESGAILTTFYLVAAAMNLQCCGLGIHDTPNVRKSFHLPQSWDGAGGCIISR
jgi:SagB-type dehydrogenase family enzyme